MSEAYRWRPAVDLNLIALASVFQLVTWRYGLLTRRPRRLLLPALAALAIFLLAAAPASATFHLMQVREIYPGSAVNPEADYVELQMWAAGQNFVGGHVLRTYNSTGGVTGTTTFASNVARGANQSTILLATPQAEAAFGVVADAPLPAPLSPVAGAVCWETIDCVAWGAFTGSTPSPAGSPAALAGIPDGMALRRSIAPGCATLLDPEDDHNNSAADFVAVPPGPRPNSVAPTEQSCSAPTGGGTGGPGTGTEGGQGPGGPQTKLRGEPAKQSSDRTPTFRFTGSPSDVKFECRIDGKRFHRCRSPFTAPKLSFGQHRFSVRAVVDGTPDPTPASYKFRIVRPVSGR